MIEKNDSCITVAHEENQKVLNIKPGRATQTRAKILSAAESLGLEVSDAEMSLFTALACEMNMQARAALEEKLKSPVEEKPKQ